MRSYFSLNIIKYIREDSAHGKMTYLERGSVRCWLVQGLLGGEMNTNTHTHTQLEHNSFSAISYRRWLMESQPSS